MSEMTTVQPPSLLDFLPASLPPAFSATTVSACCFIETADKQTVIGAANIGLFFFVVRVQARDTLLVPRSLRR